jgi:hypothetical protein
VIATIILVAILAAMVAAFIAFYRYSRTPEWGDSDIRKAALELLVSIGPFWGMHFKAPRPELPTVITPGVDPEPLPIWSEDEGTPPALGAGQPPPSRLGQG